ncbi:MAG: acetyl-CoA hydrolase [Clostridiales bacterium]|nr:acetyl-CoA hydrolase [Clostridiales bacterium]
MYEDRIKSASLREKVIPAEEAAAFIKDGMTIGTSGFTRIGYPKAIPGVIAETKSARDLTLISGASVGDALDGAFARAGLTARRYPFQTQKDVQNGINQGVIQLGDIHLSRVAGMARRGLLGRIDLAILECCLIEEDGSFVPTLSVGVSNVMAECADKVLLELNLNHAADLAGIHDIADLDTAVLTLRHPTGRAGSRSIPLDPSKILGVVVTDLEDQHWDFPEPDDTAKNVASMIIDLLAREVKLGRLPEKFCVQSGTGMVANAAMDLLSQSAFRDLTMYTEVIQDGALHLIEEGTIAAASCTSLCLSAQAEAHFYDRLPFFKERIVMRPQEISNCDALVRRFGLVSMNTAVEADLYGNVNSSHVLGSSIINGIGGSADFTRNAALSIFITPSLAKGGDISCIVPMVTHTDNSEHDVQILVTEQGMADLRGLSPKERAAVVIDNCCHPEYRPMLKDYFEKACLSSGNAHTPHDLQEAFAMHLRYQASGSMKA